MIDQLSDVNMLGRRKDPELLLFTQPAVHDVLSETHARSSVLHHIEYSLMCMVAEHVHVVTHSMDAAIHIDCSMPQVQSAGAYA